MRVVLALPPAVEDRLLAALLRAGHEVPARPAAAELTAVLAALRPDAALVSAAVLGPEVRDAADEAGVLLIVVASDPGGRSRAAALGLREVVADDAPWEAFDRLLSGETLEPPAAARPRRSGRVVTVWGPTGAPGRTSTAITIAAELALAGEGVLLVDADTHGAAVAPSLGLLDEAPGFAAACRLAGTDQLDAAQLDRVAEHYRLGGLRVLTGIARPDRWPELSAERVAAVLRLCRTEADTVVVDAGFDLEGDEGDPYEPRRNAATVAALHEADLVVAVGAADPIGLARFLRAHGELLGLVDAEIVRVLIGRVRASAVGLAPGTQIASTLLRFGGISDAVLVPNDPAALDAALLAGRTLQETAPRSPALAALRDFTRRELLPAARVPARPRRRWQLLPLG